MFPTGGFVLLLIGYLVAYEEPVLDADGTLSLDAAGSANRVGFSLRRDRPPRLSWHLRRIVMARAVYWLTPPTRLTFIVSVVLVILALLVRYAHVVIPVVSAHVFETLFIGYLVLLLGNLFRGL